MPLATPPDAELLAIDWLDAHADIGSSVKVGTRKTTLPGLVVTRIGGVPLYPGRVDKPRLDVEAWASSRTAAYDLAAAAYAVLHAMPSGTHTNAVVTAVRDFLGLTWQPDPPTDTPKWLFSVELTVRPQP